MVQCLRTLAALPEDSVPSSGLHRHLHTCDVYSGTHIYTKIFIFLRWHQTTQDCPLASTYVHTHPNTHTHTHEEGQSVSLISFQGLVKVKVIDKKILECYSVHCESSLVLSLYLQPEQPTKPVSH